MKTRISLWISVLLILFAPFWADRLNAGDKADIATQALDVLRKAHTRLSRFTLDNGMVCLLQNDASAPVVSVQIWLRTGSIHEQEYLGSGLSHAIEHMIFKGTETRAPGDITREINEAGGDINAYTTLDRTVFFTDLPSRNWRVGLRVLADAMMHASFPRNEWTQEREVILREFAMGKDDPERELGKRLWDTAYAVHPYRIPVIGYEDAFRTLTRQDLVTFFQRHYRPDNMILVVVGKMDAAEVEAEIRALFADFPRASRAPVVLPVEPPQLAPRFARQTGAYKVSRLEWVYHTVPLTHPDTPALDMLAQIAGQGRSSWLNREIKEGKRLVHSIDAWSHTPQDPGLFGISAVFDPTNEAAVIAAIQQDVDSWPSLSWSASALDKARRQVLTSQLSALQSMKGQADSYASGECEARDPLFSETYIEQLASITPADLQAVARKYLKPENRTLVILSPSETKAGEASVGTNATDVLKAEKIVLPNGVPLLIRENHRLPFVYVTAALGGGLLSETSTNNGLTSLMSELLVRGTRTRSSDEIAKTVESLGASLSPFSGYNSFGLQAHGLASDAPALLEILSDCLLNSTFPDVEVAKQKVVQSAAIRAKLERPFFLAQETLKKSLFQDHPYAWDPSGTLASIERISRSDLQAHHKRQVVSENLVLAIFGDIPAAQARKLAESCFRKLAKGTAPELDHPSPNPPIPSRSKRVEPKEQAIVLAGFPGVDLMDTRCDSLTLLQTALSGLSSDLAIDVRDTRGLAYYVGAYQQAGVEPGLFVLYAGTRADAVDSVETLMRDEIARLAGGGLRTNEMERARNQMLADYEMGLQDDLSLAMNCALNELCGLGYAYTFTARERFEALTLQDVRRAAETILSTNKMAISLVLPEQPTIAP